MKPKFTSTQAYSLIGEIFNNSPHLPNFAYMNPTRSGEGIRSFYLHGLAEELCGFDLVYHIDGHFHMAEGETECIVVDERGKEHPALAIIWRDKGDDKALDFYTGEPIPPCLRGFIVLKQDKKALEYARNCATERTSMI